MSPDDTMSEMQERLDDYLRLGVPNVWVIDPWKNRAWAVTTAGWQVASDALRASDGRVSMKLADVVPPR